MPSSAAERSASIVSCGKRASASAISSARSRCCPGATTSVTRPIRSASSASTMRPVRIMSSARPRPTMRGRRWVPPSISGTPKRRSVKPSLASSVAIRRSHQSASSRPAGEAPARDRGDRRLGRDQAREAERAVLELEARAEALDRLEVGAGAEGKLARAGDTSTRASSSATKRAVALGQQLGGRTVDRVAALLAVDREHRRGAAALVGDAAIGHGGRSFSDCSHRRPARLARWAVQIPPRARGPVPTGSRPFWAGARALPADALAQLGRLARVLALLERPWRNVSEDDQHGEEDDHAEARRR